MSRQPIRPPQVCYLCGLPILPNEAQVMFKSGRHPEYAHPRCTEHLWGFNPPDDLGGDEPQEVVNP